MLDTTTSLQDHIALARRVARHIGRQVGSWAPLDELEGAALVGLAEASSRYDQRENDNFEAYAYPRIRGAVLDELRRFDIRPRRVRQRHCRSQRAREKLRHQLGREPTASEIADVTGESSERAAAVLSASPVLFVQVDDNTAADTTSNVAQSIDRERIREQVHAAIDALDPRSREVVKLYFFQGLKLREIGLRLGITESRVSQLKSQAMTALNQQLKAALD